jgi:hypothetical protein
MSETQSPLVRTWGGRRPGQGRRFGSKNKRTIEIETAREEMRQRILENTGILLDAQFDLALGLWYEDKDNDGVKRVYKAKPDGKAIDNLLSRVYGKAPQTLNGSVSIPELTALGDAVKDILVRVGKQDAVNGNSRTG